MKHIPGIFLASLFLLTAVDLRAATDTTVEQAMTVSITENYLSTNTVLGTTTIKTATITTATVVKALAFQIGQLNLTNAQLLHIINLTTNGESIILRKTGTTDADVTAYFGALTNNFWSSSDTNQSALTANIARTAIQDPTLNKTNLQDSLNSLTLSTDNLAFTLTNGYGTAFYFSRITGTTPTKVTNVWANISCNGGVNLSTYNVGVWTNPLLFTNAAGPAHGTFSTTSGTFKAGN